jgi:acetyltransferase
VLFQNVRSGGFDGRVVAINPALGVPRLEEPCDLALISVPARAVPEAVADAARAGCQAAIVLSSGFGETGDEGRRVEARLRENAQAAGMRLVGPNCMGVVSRYGEGWLNGSYFWQLPDRAGAISMISQSGAFGGIFFAEARRRGLGVARFLSVGNSADVNETDVLEHLGGDSATAAIGIFAEAFRDGRRFVEVARKVTERKPVVVLKAGKGGKGAAAAASHTGSLAGRHGAAQAAFRRAGVIEAEDTDSFFDVLTVLAHGHRNAHLPSDAPLGPPARAGRRVAILTISGGPGVLASDEAERSGLELPPPAPATIDRLRRLAPSFAAVGNPVDLTPQCPPANFGEAIAAVFGDRAYDGIVVINCGLDIPEFGEGVVAAARETGKPLTAYVLQTPRIEAALNEAGIPLFDSPERAVRAYAAKVG